MDALNFAEKIKPEIVEIRRTLHKNAEVGNSLPKTKEFVINKLTEFGCKPTEICESGIAAVLEGSKTGRTLMLRADMDALKLKEKTGLPFASENGSMHACGHDIHTAMLLGAAKILKQYESELCGKIKFVFQPNEEGLEGAKAMLDAGVLKNPTVDAGLALHVISKIPSGIVLCGKGTFMAGVCFFRIKIKGTGCHGAMPETGVDPINIGTHVYLSLQEILTREISPTIPAAITIGRFYAGDAPNVIPEELIIEGSIRSKDSKALNYIYERMEKIATDTATLFRGSATVEKLSSAPPLVNNPDLMRQMTEYLNEIFTSDKIIELNEGGMGSEDFAVFSQEIPCSYLLIGGGTEEENETFGKPMHNEQIIFNEDILPLGTAIFAHLAKRWLEDNS